MHKLAEICVRRPVFATMLVLALTVVGVFSYGKLGVDLLPKVDLPTVNVTVSDPGSSAEAVETEITKIIEDSVNTIGGIEDVRSTSVEGLSQIVISFELEKNGDIAAQEVRDKVNLVLPDLPETAELPVVQKLDPDASPVLRAVVAGPGSIQEVTRIADKRVKELIENIGGVGQVEILGGRDREIQVWVDPDRMQAYNLTVSDVANALDQQNLELPGGNVEEGARELTVRTMGRLADPAEFENIAVADREGYAVKIRDIGYVEDGPEEAETASRFNGQPAVTLVVSKQSGTNTVAVADAIKARLAEIEDTLPRGYRIEVVGDQSIFIKAALHSVQTHLIEGGILASIVIFFFLANIRTTLIATIAIPASIVSTFGLMNAMGYTLNQITLLALTLMVGIVIDDAILVLENIYRFIEEKGMPPFKAAIEGTRDIGLAVTATTLSLLAVFIPVGFMGGIVGRFMSSFGLTAAFAVAVSLLVSFTLTPMLSARFIRQQGGTGAANQRKSKNTFFFRHLDGYYTKLLKWAMAHKLTVVAVSLLVMLSTLPLFVVIGKNFLPEDDRSEFEMSVRAPEGTSLAASIALSERIAREIRQLPGVADTLTTAGGNQQTPNESTIYVRLASIEDRELSQQDLMERARQVLEKYPGNLRTSVQQVSGIAAGRNADIQYVISGPDLDKLDNYSKAITARLTTLPYVVDVDSSLISGKPELRVEIDRARAADLSVKAGDIARAVNTLIGGEVVSRYNTPGDQYDVRLRATGEFRSGIEGLNRIVVASNQGPVTLDNVVKITESTGPGSIDRLNRQRQVTIYANVLPGGSQANVIDNLNRFASELNMGPTYSTGLIGQSRELGRAGYYFGLAFLLAFTFMYMVLAAQFESFLHPITILLTLPMAVPFGILALLIANQTVNVFSGLGLLLLFGIVKKNAILQIDHTNMLRAAGMPRYEAIIQANRDRLRPILMTTISLVAGMTPLVFSSGPGAATNRSIGVLVAGGQTLCLLLTLIAVPVLYSLFEDMKELRLWNRAGNWYEAVSSFWNRKFAPEQK